MVGWSGVQRLVDELPHEGVPFAVPDVGRSGQLLQGCVVGHQTEPGHDQGCGMGGCQVLPATRREESDGVAAFGYCRQTLVAVHQDADPGVAVCDSPGDRQCFLKRAVVGVEDCVASQRNRVCQRSTSFFSRSTQQEQR